MDIALGMMIGAFISIISIFFTMNHIVSEDKKKISLTEYYKNSDAAEKHVVDFLKGPYQETFFKLMEIESFQVMGPASKNLIKSLDGITDDFRIEVDGFKRNF